MAKNKSRKSKLKNRKKAARGKNRTNETQYDPVLGIWLTPGGYQRKKK